MGISHPFAAQAAARDARDAAEADAADQWRAAETWRAESAALQRDAEGFRDAAKRAEDGALAAASAAQRAAADLAAQRDALDATRDALRATREKLAAETTRRDAVVHERRRAEASAAEALDVAGAEIDDRRRELSRLSRAVADQKPRVLAAANLANSPPGSAELRRRDRRRHARRDAAPPPRAAARDGSSISDEVQRLARKLHEVSEGIDEITPVKDPEAGFHVRTPPRPRP